MTALRDRGLVFDERDIREETVLAEFRDRLPRAKAIPQIFIDGEHIGGFEDLQDYLERHDQRSKGRS